MRSSIFAPLALAVALSPIANAQCTSLNTVPQWLWQQLFYQSYSTSEPDTDIAQAAAGWNGAQSDFTIGTDYYDDFDISDDYSLQVLAFTILHSQAEAGCANQFDGCGVCMNSSVMLYAQIRLNPLNIAFQQSQAPAWNIDQWVTFTVGHEMGHAFGLDDFYYDPTDCAHTTIMYWNGAGAYSCGIDVAQVYCDGGLVDSEYSSGFVPGEQGLGPDYPPSFCGYCNQGPC